MSSRSLPRRRSGSLPARISTRRASGCRRARPGTRCRRRSTTGAPAGRAGSTGATRPKPRVARSPGWSGVAAVDGGGRRHGLGLVGLVASSLPEGSRVLAPDVEFTSTLFPFLVQAAPRRDGPHRARRRARRGDRRRRRTSSRSAPCRWRPARWQTSKRSPAAANAHGALTVVDATQACGWLPLDGYALRHRRGRRLQVAPLAARHRVHGGRAGPARRRSSRRQPAGTRARTSTRRTSAARCGSQRTPAASTPRPPGTAGSAPRRRSRSSRRSGSSAIHAHDVGLANRFRAGLGLEPGDSAIVFVDVPGAAARLERAGIRAAVRGGRVRTSWHLYNTDADVDRRARSAAA